MISHGRSVVWKSIRAPFGTCTVCNRVTDSWVVQKIPKVVVLSEETTLCKVTATSGVNFQCLLFLTLIIIIMRDLCSTMESEDKEALTWPGQ